MLWEMSAEFSSDGSESDNEVPEELFMNGIGAQKKRRFRRRGICLSCPLGGDRGE